MPSSYTPNLGYEKVEPGEQTGTWGGSLNTNFELIGESVAGVVTDEVVYLSAGSTSGSPHTFAISDGASSTGRHAYIEFANAAADATGDIYAQYGPSDSTKLTWIKNSTGQNLILFQGTYNAGRATTIADGDTALIMFTGQGAAASSASLVMSNVVMGGFKLPNNTSIAWDNAAGTDTLDVKLDASNDLILTLNGATILQYDSSANDWNAQGKSITTTGNLSVAGITASGAISGSNLSGTNTGDEVAASTTVAGVVERATQAEVDAGTDATRYISPLTLANYVGLGSDSPLTTKGDLYTYSTVDARLGVGTDGQVLTADSTQATGLKWETIASGGLGNIVEDTSPQLGAALDSNDFDIDMTNGTGIRFWEVGGGPATGNYMRIRAASTMAANYTLILPSTDGTSGQYLKTDGSGNLSWDAPTAGETPAILSNGVTPSLNTGISASEVRSLIGAGTGDGDITSVEIIAGDGLTGGGSDTTGSVSLTVNMGTPSTLDETTTNANTPGSHTHAISNLDKVKVSGAGVDSTMYPILSATTTAGWQTPYVDPSFEWDSVTNNLTIGGAVNANSVAATGAVTGGSMTALGTITGGTVNSDGTMTATGEMTAASYNTSSARHLKNLVSEFIPSALLMALKPMIYTLKSGGSRQYMGLFADEVEQVFPELVTHDDEGVALTVDYQQLIMPIIAMLQQIEHRLNVIEMGAA